MSGLARAMRLCPYAVLVAITGGILAWQLQLVGDFKVDDAYISFAYSKNLAEGRGLVYGLDLRVEGYSNFLWVMCGALLELVAPAQLYTTARVISFIFLGVALLFAFRICRLEAGLWTAAFAPALLALTTDLTRAAQSALETVPFAAALTWTTYAYLTESPDRRRKSGLGLLLLCLTRIDGIGLAAFFVCFEGVAAWMQRRLSLGSLARWLAAPILLYAAYFAWRYSYYGLPLPTTYYAKAALGVQDRFRGLEYVWSVAQDLGIPVLLGVGMLSIGRKPTAAKLLLMSLVITQLAYSAYVGGDWMPFSRFLLPVLPSAVVLFLWGLTDAVELLSAALGRLGGGARPLASIAAGVPLLVVAVLVDSHTVNTPAERAKLASAAHVASHTAGLVDAQHLYKWMPRERTDTLVTDYGGVFGYFTGARIIEMWGLCNRDIALKGSTDGVNPIYGKTCIACYKDFDPDYFHANVPLSRPSNEIRTKSEIVDRVFQGKRLDRVLGFNQNYIAGRVIDTRTNQAFYFLEKRRPNRSYVTREPAPHIRVEYPFGSSRG